ncbi:MAG: hypothetical protein LKJ80_01060 [Oscillibacter sp.]|jgi:hypothetical protein|nr:hypothetical protein [Oscillibacter sp.]
MTEEQIAVALEGHGHEIKSLKHRMDNAEKSSAAVNRLATAVEVMATKQDGMARSVNALAGKVDLMEARPGRRWDGLVNRLIYAAAAAFFTWVLCGCPGLH